MHGRWICFGIVLTAAAAAVRSTPAQDTPGVVAAATQATTGGPQYTLTTGVDEVSLPFHAADHHGVTIDTLTLNDLRVLDNGKAPKEIVSFDVLRDLPIRAGILMDTSRSVLVNLRRNQQISSDYVRQYLRRPSSSRPGDEAFVMRFDFEPKLIQSWTEDSEMLEVSIRNVAQDHESRLGGTAIFDAVYVACRDEFGKIGKIGNLATGNVLFLFTDGLDNASHARLQDDVNMCQQTSTAIYVFSAAARSLFIEGQTTLSELAEQTGGRIFFDQSAQGIHDELGTIEANMRSQYRLVYKPAKIKADGSFHHIQLESSGRSDVITARSGYYAER